LRVGEKRRRMLTGWGYQSREYLDKLGISPELVEGRKAGRERYHLYIAYLLYTPYEPPFEPPERLARAKTLKFLR